jgi:hypothetical protein
MSTLAADPWQPDVKAAASNSGAANRQFEFMLAVSRGFKNNEGRYQWRFVTNSAHDVGAAAAMGLGVQRQKFLFAGGNLGLTPPNTNPSRN